ncbi:MAG: hypothetical protein ACYTG1_03425 [Planctomycetota bacterium]|jgi:hypothetical protein
MFSTRSITTAAGSVLLLVASLATSTSGQVQPFAQDSRTDQYQKDDSGVPIATPTPLPDDTEVIEPVPLPVPGDANGDGEVTYFDLLDILGNWGTCEGKIRYCRGDANGDGFVDVEDMLLMLANWE